MLVTLLQKLLHSYKIRAADDNFYHIQDGKEYNLPGNMRVLDRNELDV